MKVHRVLRYWFALTVLALPAVARGQGFGLNEIGSCAVARSFAVTGAPCKDASRVFWNPASTTSLTGFSILAGAASIKVNGDFTQDTTRRVWKANVPTRVVPHVFLNYHGANSRAAYGLGVYVPYGLTSEWDDPTFPGRFSDEKAAISTIYIQPNLAWQINKNWSVGGGPIVGRSSVELKQALDLSSQPVPGLPFTFGSLGIARRTQFADARLKGDATGYGAQVGVFGQLTPAWTFGARFLSQIIFAYDNADATFTQVSTGLVLAANNPFGLPANTPLDAVLQPQFASGGKLVSQKVRTSLAHPAQLQAGFGYTGFQGWTLSADYAWIGWKAFKTLPITFGDTTLSRTLFEDYNNSSSIRLGVERAFTNGFALRAGFTGASSAAPDVTVTPLLPEQDREYLNLGAGIPLFADVSLDASYSHVFFQGRRGRVDERTSRSMSAAQLNTGVYHLSANVLSFSLKASF